MSLETNKTFNLANALRVWATDARLIDPASKDLMDAADRMETMRKLLERAADIVEYHDHKESSPIKAKWLADAKEIGITPCPF